LLCLRRWQVLFSLFDELVFKPDDLVICIDWDTFLFKPINKLIQYLNDKHDPALPFLACFFRNGLRDSVLAGNIPIFEICPNLLFINKRSIDIYASLVSHILINQDNLKRIFINRFFNDMSIFSVLVSWLFVHFSCDCVFDLDLISDEVEIFTDHNLRVQWQGRHYFLTNKYTIPSYIDYTNSGFVELKWFKVIGGIPYVQTNKGDYICCSCLHFSSIEAKYLLANGHTSYKMSAKSDNLISSL
jgi:hypothetical protein